MLLVAAVCFWASWAFMPGVGVTDSATILQLVGSQPDLVLISSILQLISAAALASAIPGLAVYFHTHGDWWGRLAPPLLAMGACGDAADAVYHQLAFEMVRPGVDQRAMLPVMQRMQSVDLLYVLPLIVAFLLGCIVLAVGAARIGIVAPWNPRLYVLWPLIIVTARWAGMPSRIAGLTCLGLLSISLGWIGLATGKFEYRKDTTHATDLSRA